MHLDRGLIIGRSREDLGLFGRDGGIPLDDLGHDAAHGLDAQRQGGDVEKQQSLDLTAEHARLQRGAHGDALVGVDALERFFAHEFLNGLLHGRDPGGAAHQQDLIDLGRRQAAVGQGLLDRAHGGLHKGRGQLIEFRTGQGHIQMFRPSRVGRYEGQADVARKAA